MRAAQGRSFGLYVAARGASELAGKIGVVAVGWQIYALTGSVLALGLVGLTQFLPAAALSLLAGHAADRFDRRRLVQACQGVSALASAALAWGAAAGRLSAGELFGAVAAFGALAAFEEPAAGAILVAVAPQGRLQQATSTTATALEGVAIAGPALGGLIYALAPGAAYGAMAALWLLAVVLNGAVRLAAREPAGDQPTIGSMLAGFGFVRRQPAVLGAISLDMVAVLLGGATALLPVFAKDILHVGPFGLGLLRCAPSVGALGMAAALHRWPIERRAGRRLFQAVVLFGVGTAVFGLSRSIWLSLAALVVLGAADMVSVVIRATLVQAASPDNMRGRVGAVNGLFVGASNQLGGFESGLLASLVGAGPAVLLGGIGTVVVAGLWLRLFPALARLDRLEMHEETRPATDLA